MRPQRFPAPPHAPSLTTLAASLAQRSAAQDHNDLFKTNFVSAVDHVVIDGVAQPAPTQLPWYPDGLGWQINVGKTVIRKSPEYRKLQQYLVYETDVVRPAAPPYRRSSLLWVQR